MFRSLTLKTLEEFFPEIAEARTRLQVETDNGKLLASQNKLIVSLL